MDPALRELLDRQQIASLQTRYATALDDRDWERLRSCFAPDAIADYGPGIPPFEGYDAIEKLCRSTLEPLDASHHFIANHEIELLSGDEARARCYVRAQHVRNGCDGGNLFEIGGYYRDELKRGERGWRIHRRQLVMTWRDGNPKVLSPSA